MKIKWFPPFDKFFGSSSYIPLAGPTPVSRVLEELMREQPEFERYARFADGGRRPEGLLVCRGGQILTLADELAPDDELEMVVLVTGG